MSPSLLNKMEIQTLLLEKNLYVAFLKISFVQKKLSVMLEGDILADAHRQCQEPTLIDMQSTVWY